MLICLGLTIASMFSDGWRDFKDSETNDPHIPTRQGIFKFTCKMPDGSASSTCDKWWENLKGWEKAVVACMCIALVVEIVALAWNFFTCFACCCKKYVIHPLTMFATIVTIALAIAVILYGAYNSDALKNIENNFKTGTAPKSEVGYSFYMACGALVCSAASIVVAILTVWFAEKCM